VRRSLVIHRLSTAGPQIAEIGKAGGHGDLLRKTRLFYCPAP
jgi:hypothetical protein